jgi:hypothetical protein
VRKFVLVLTATALILCSVTVWAGGSRTVDDDEGGPTFIICNAL